MENVLEMLKRPCRQSQSTGDVLVLLLMWFLELLLSFRVISFL